MLLDVDAYTGITLIKSLKQETRMTFTIDTGDCTFCGLCAAECPPGVISLDKAGLKAEINHENCIECSHCGMICPAGAVRVDGKRLESYPAGAADRLAEPEITGLMEHLIKSKRSVRHYISKPLAAADLEAVLLAGSTTATATNSQQVNADVLQGSHVRNASVVIAGVLLKVVRFGLHPAGRFLLKLVGLGRYADGELLENYRKRIDATIDGTADAFFFNAPAVVILTYPSTSGGKRFGRTDCALAGENMMLTAHARGIGSCMIGFAEAALFTKSLRKKIGVPSDRRIGLVFTLGYQKPEYYRYPERRKWKV